ncbi:MAG TPA: class IV adenylate cyclase [Candidatus Saccharimonadales bacterium]|nr:class IV adenylate cyclase [Candidatus Saccharimonadales bacterium]
MQDEIEAKFLDINFDELRAKLEAAGGKMEKPMRLMRRVTIHNEFMRTDKDAFVRVRDEGDKVVITYKQFDELSVDGTKEIEVEVNDFDKTVELLAQAGLPYDSLQESKRETWKFESCEVVLDEWPWLKPYIEVEGPNEAAVRQAAEGLGLDWQNAVFGDVMAAYRAEYTHLTDKDTVGNLAEVKFGAALPEMFRG